MEQRKKKILMCTEFSMLNTGYATYTKELLSRLYKTNKYEIAEFATYGSSSDPRSKKIKWKWYPNLPDNPNDKDEKLEYNAKTTNQFGEWKFEKVCLDFQPDIVFDIRDHWMLQYQIYSPFRPYYYHILMPTVDAFPQEEVWINDFMQTDAILTYTDFSYRVLQQQAGNKINLIGTASPGADIDILKPVPDKIKHKTMMGLPESTLIIGTVMRNQKRKLYPDLFFSFAEFLRNAPPNLAKRTYLYCHTSYPDIGWNIPLLLKESGISHKTYFTYICKHCGWITAYRYSDINIPCKKCGHKSLGFPSADAGVNRDALAKIYNLFDIYVQYAVCEGAGMPQIEAGSCGVPIMSVNYSGMEDILTKLDGIPIDIVRYMREAETHRIMALPDNKDFIKKLTEFLLEPSSVRESRGRRTRELCIKNYNWDNVAKVWEKVFDAVELKPIEQTWKSPPRIFTPAAPERIPNNLENDDFVRWCILNMACEPKLLNSYIEHKLIRDLNYGKTFDYMGVPYYTELSAIGVRAKLRPFSREDCINELMEMVSKRNIWESKRAELMK